MNPGEALATFDQFDPTHVEQMYEIFEYSRAHCPVFNTETHPGYWLVSTWDDAKAVLSDWTTYSNLDGVTLHGPGSPPALPAASDPPIHKEYRALMAPFFTRAAIMEHEATIRHLAVQQMEKWLPNRRVEFVKEFAGPFAFAAFSHLFLRSKNPKSAETFLEAADGIVQDSGPAAYGHLMNLVREFVAERRASGERYGDMIDQLHNAVIDGRPLTEDELLGFAFSAAAAGFETNVGTMSIIMMLVAQDPTLEPRIMGSDWARKHLDEFLRYQSPVVGLARTLACPAELGGQQLEAGDKVVVQYASVNRDESKFPNAERLDFDRDNRGQHMAYSYGIHRCLGAISAEIVVGIGLDELTKRATNFRLQAGAEISYNIGVVRRPTTVPLEFDLR